MNLLQSLNIATKRATTQNRWPEITRDVLKGGEIKIVNNQAVIYGHETAGLIRNSYMVNVDVYSPARYIIDKVLRGKYFNYKVKDEKALSDYRMLKGPGANDTSLKEAHKIRNKALANTTNPGIDKLLTQPNPSQSFKALTEMAIAYKLLTGERFVQKIDGITEPVTRLYILPSTQMEVYPGDEFLSVGKYVYIPTKREFKPEEITFSKMFHPDINGYGEGLRGLSPLRVMAMQIQKSNEGILSGIKQYQNGGPPGLLSLWDESVPLTEEQARQYEDTIARKSGSGNRGKVNVTGMRAEWVKMGLSPVDLEALESGVFDLRAICRGFKLDSKLFNDNSASSYNNILEAGKAAIVNAVIPALEDWGDDLNDIIQPFNVKGERNFIDSDVTHFPELAEDLDKIMERMTKGPFTPNQILEAMHYERFDGAHMDEPWFGNDRTPLSQFGAGVEPEPVKNDGSY